MIYMKTKDGEVKILVLDTANIEELRKGRPCKTPDGSVVVAWTPDPVWLADRILDTDGDVAAIGRLVDEAARRPQKPLDRPKFAPHTKDFTADREPTREGTSGE